MWAGVEEMVVSMFVHVAGMEMNETNQAMARCFGFRKLLESIKIGVVAKYPNTIQVDEIIDTIDYIDNTLRTGRNRYVHDDWMFFPDTSRVVKNDPTPRIRRPQAKQPREMFARSFTDETIDDLIVTIDEIEQNIIYLANLISPIRGAPWSLEGLLAKRPQRHLVPLRQGTRNP
jgi:hypothetical protein